MPLQTDYGFTSPVALFGMSYSVGSATLDITGAATERIDFGRGVVHVTSIDNGRTTVSLPTATGIFAGVAMLDHTKTINDLVTPLTQLVSNDLAHYTVGDDVRVRQIGYIWVYSEVAITALDAPVYCRHTVNGALVKGNFRTDADTARATLVTKARWARKTTAAGLALLLLDL